jgi:hypothetical protein
MHKPQQEQCVYLQEVKSMECELQMKVLKKTIILATWEDWNWEDHSSRPAQIKSSWDPISTNIWVKSHMPVIPSQTG